MHTYVHSCPLRPRSMLSYAQPSERSRICAALEGVYQTMSRFSSHAWDRANQPGRAACRSRDLSADAIIRHEAADGRAPVTKEVVILAIVIMRYGAHAECATRLHWAPRAGLNMIPSAASLRAFTVSAAAPRACYPRWSQTDFSMVLCS